MNKLVIIGSISQLKVIAKLNKIRAKRHGLKILLNPELEEGESSGLDSENVESLKEEIISINEENAFEISALDLKIAKHLEEVENLKSLNEDQVSQIENLKSEIRGLNSQIDSDTQRIVDLKSELETLKRGKLTVQEVAKQILECETLEDLDKFKGDTRKFVIEAYNNKLKDFE